MSLPCLWVGVQSGIVHVCLFLRAALDRYHHPVRDADQQLRSYQLQKK